ncbi:MAG: hypothetical protein M3377_01390, partial [Actinomycetota bacterium]|nr:hypothetical protein [Actinomycetota bacterium]
MRRVGLLAAAVALVGFSAAALSGAAVTGPLQADPAGIINLPAGYSYSTIAVMCTPARSTESGATVPLPEDPDGQALFRAPG